MGQGGDPTAEALPVMKAEARYPVCGMTVDVARAKHTTQWEGRTIYFCCPHRKLAFEKNPQAYAVEASL
jgi:YHS domain-containing protein